MVDCLCTSVELLLQVYSFKSSNRDLEVRAPNKRKKSFEITIFFLKKKNSFKKKMSEQNENLLKLGH